MEKFNKKRKLEIKPIKDWKKLYLIGICIAIFLGIYLTIPYVKPF